MQRSLVTVVQEKPFKDYAAWWPVGPNFTRFMSEAIHREWATLPHNSGDLGPVSIYTEFYLKTVYPDVSPQAELVDRFVHGEISLRSGEFDALSYAFYRSAFDHIGSHLDAYDQSFEIERRLFTKRVGKRFFDRVAEHLNLILPQGLTTEDEYKLLNAAVDQVGRFLKDEGYLRDHFAFYFDVETTHQGKTISQREDQLINRLELNQTGYALYEMGYPIILPSAVYLYHTLGEAQHHSSRTIEELFDRIGFVARETDDFDPIGHPSDLVVELWEIRST